MTTIAVPFPAARPTPFERTLLKMSSQLSRMATSCMQRRAQDAVRRALSARAGDDQRDTAAAVRSGLLPR